MLDMDWQFSIYLLPLCFAGAVSLVLAYFAARRRGKRTATQTAGILGAAAIWAFADAARLASVDEATKLLFHDLRFFGSTTLVLATLLFALEYTNRERWMTRRHVAAYALPFVVTLALVVSGRPLGHDLIRAGVEVATVDGLRIAEFEFGTWFYVNALYSYLLLTVVFAFYAGVLRRERAGTYRKQTGAITISLLIPWVLNGLFLADVTLVDFTAVGLAVTGVMHYAAIFWFDLLDLVPIARSTIVDHIEHGVAVIDTDERVVDVNEEMTATLGVDRRDVLGVPIHDLETDVPDLVDALAGGADGQDLSVEMDGEIRQYELENTPVYSDLDRHLGRIVMVRDVTEARRRQAALRERTERLAQQNEQLNRFADVVSHDLRNPLSVARGYLDLAAEDPDPAHFDRVESALDRMDEIVGDVLALARQSTNLEETESVPVADVAADAWDTVDPPAATLEVVTNAHVEADRSRLQQLLENLFRNAVEHGSTSPRSPSAHEDAVEHGSTSPPSQAHEDAVEHDSTSTPSQAREDAVEHDSTSPPSQAREDAAEHGGDAVTVTVGDLPDGFYVEDDGPGIPAADREEVFTHGFSSSEGGTGFGLSIVSAIVDAHGWEIEVTDGTAGGARFEITGVGQSTGQPDLTANSPGRQD